MYFTGSYTLYLRYLTVMLNIGKGSEHVLLGAKVAEQQDASSRFRATV